MRRLIIRLLLGIIIGLLMLEGLLRLFDPLGLIYFPNIDYLNTHLEPSPNREYMLPAGQYILHGWSATEADNNTRLVPDNADGDCTLLFVGDSVTWGEGVNDDATWVNLVARQLPGVNVINAGLNGYNSEDVRNTIPDFPGARAIIYLVIDNDPFVTAPFSKGGAPEYLSAIDYYLLYLFRTRREPPQSDDWPRFYRDMDAMSTDPRVTFVAFDAPFGRDLAARYPVRLIPMYTHWISAADGHANAEGNQQIAAAMLPIAQSVVKDKCGG